MSQPARAIAIAQRGGRACQRCLGDVRRGSTKLNCGPQDTPRKKAELSAKTDSIALPPTPNQPDFSTPYLRACRVIKTPLRQSNINADKRSMTCAGFKSVLRAVKTITRTVETKIDHPEISNAWTKEREPGLYSLINIAAHNAKIRTNPPTEKTTMIAGLVSTIIHLFLRPQQ